MGTSDETRTKQDFDYAVHAAHAYPKLVEALQKSPQVPFSPSNNGERWDDGYKAGFFAALNIVFEKHQRLLRDLGEA